MDVCMYVSHTRTKQQMHELDHSYNRNLSIHVSKGISIIQVYLKL